VPVHRGRQLGEGGEVVRGERQQHSLRPHFQRQVTADQKRGEDRAFGLVLRVLEEPVVARDQLAVAHPQHHAAHVVAVAGEPHRVGVAPSDQLDGLRLLQLVEPFQGIAHLGSPLEIELLRGLLHALAQPDAHVHGLAFEEQHDVVDHAPVIGLALITDARGPAALDVVVEARAGGRLARQIPVTRPHGENATDDPERLAQRGHVGVGPEKARPRHGHATHHQHPRKRLSQRHGDARVALVVGEADVEPRLVLLDEIVLEQQRLRLVRDDDRLEVGDLRDECRALRRGAAVGTEVARHPGAQALRLAYIDGLAGRILPQIHAGLVGKGV